MRRPPQRCDYCRSDGVLPRFAKAMPNMHGWVSTSILTFIRTHFDSHEQQHPRDVEDIWKDMFTYLYREEQNFIFPITIHPDVSG